MRLRIELDISSGLPNPRWEVAGACAVRLAARIRAARTGAVAPSAPDGLGYRGLIVHIDGEPEAWRLGGGVIEHGGRRYRDEGLEAAFLTTVPAEVQARYGAALP